MSVWLGTPQSGHSAEDVLDPYTTKVGGKTVLFRTTHGGGGALPSFACPKCSTTDSVSLLAQLYAPLECYDRVLYILTCSKCATKASQPVAAPTADTSPHGGKSVAAAQFTSFCFAVRSQNFSKAYYAEQKEAHRQLVLKAEAEAQQKLQAGQRLFEEDACWDDEDDDEGDDGTPSPSDPVASSLGADTTTTTTTSAADNLPPLPEEKEHFSCCKSGCVVGGLKGRQYTNGVPLDLFLEPEKKKEKLGSTEQQLAEAIKNHGESASLDTTSMEEDDESPVDRCVRKYVERISAVPSQCVRWCPGGNPLRASLKPITPPPCPVCGAPRHFEVQLTAPLVYYLTRDIGGEKKNDSLHFSNVLVYTCSKNCYDTTPAYTPEYAVTEDEI